MAINLLLAGNFDITAECEISLLEDTSELERENLKDFIHIIIILPHPNLQTLALFQVKEIPAYDIKNFINIPLSQVILDLCNRFFEERKWQIASEQYTKHIQINSGNPETYWWLSQCYRNLNLSDKCFSTLKEGIQMQPSDPRLNFPLIIDLRISGRNQEAIISAENACQLLPDDYTFQKLKYLTVPTIYDDQEETTFYRYRYTEGLQKLIQQTSLKSPEEQGNALAGIGRLTNFYLSYQAKNDVDLQRQYGQLVHEIMGANFPKWVVPLSMPKPQQQERIRIGYASHYLHSYTGTLWLTRWLRYCDHKNFEIYCYYTGNQPGPIT